MAGSQDLGLAVRSSGRQPILPYTAIQRTEILAMLAAGRASADISPTVRPHSSLGNLPPVGYAKLGVPASQRDGTLRSIGGFAPRPVAASSLQDGQPTLPIGG